MRYAMGASAVKAGHVLVVAFLLTLLVLCACAPRRARIYLPQPIPTAKSSIVEYAVALLGKPYRSGAKGPNAFDCSGFVQYVYGRFNVSLPVSTENQVKEGYEVPRDEVEPGDAVFFAIRDEMHIGIVINPLEFVHSSKTRGVAIDSLDLPYWKKAFMHFRRFL